MKIISTKIVWGNPNRSTYIPPSVEVDAEHRGLRYEFVVNFNRKYQITGAVRTAPGDEYYTFDKIPTDILMAASTTFQNQRNILAARRS